MNPDWITSLQDITRQHRADSRVLIRRTRGPEPGNPQSWNGYAYTINNPLLYSDPDGREYTICFSHGRNCDTVSDAEFNQIRRDGTALGAVFKDNAIYNDVNGTGELVLTATFGRTGFDDFSAQANAVIFGNRNTAGLVDRAPVAGNAALALLGGGVAVGAGIGAGLYGAPAITAAIVERQVAGRIASEVANATVNHRIYSQLEKQLATAGARSIYKALRNAEKELEKHITKSSDAYFKSSIESTIKNIANQIKTIQRFIKDKGL